MCDVSSQKIEGPLTKIGGVPWVFTDHPGHILIGLFVGWLVCWLVGCADWFVILVKIFYCGFSSCVHVRSSTLSHPQHAHGHQTTRQRCCHNSCPCHFVFTMPTASSSSRLSGFHFSTRFLICFYFFFAHVGL